MQTRQLYINLTSSVAGTIYIDLPRGSRIHKADWALSTVSALTTGDQVRAELAVNSSGSQSTNDATGVLSICDASGMLTTSGAGLTCVNRSDALDVSLGNITRLYCNAAEAGAATWSVRCLVHFT